MIENAVGCTFEPSCACRACQAGQKAREEKTSAEWVASSLRALNRWGWVTVAQLVEHSHLPESTVRRALEQLPVEKKDVPGTGRRAYVTGYRLTKENA